MYDFLDNRVDLAKLELARYLTIFPSYWRCHVVHFFITPYTEWNKSLSRQPHNLTWIIRSLKFQCSKGVVV